MSRSRRRRIWRGSERNISSIPIIVDELRGPSARGRVEAYKDYLYFIYYFPIYDPKDEASTRTEIDFIITKEQRRDRALRRARRRDGRTSTSRTAIRRSR